MDNNKIAAIFDKKPNDGILSFYKTSSITPFLFLILPFFEGFYNSTLIQNNNLFWIINAIDHAIIPLVLLTIYRNKYKWIQSSFIWVKGIEKWANFAIIIIAAMTLGPFLFIYISSAFQHVFQSIILFNGVPFKQAFDGGNFSKPVLLFYATLSAAIFEEIFFKGIFFKIFIDNKQSILKTYFILSLIFAIIHWDQGFSGFLTAFIYSILSFLLYGQVKNLIPLIVLHFSIDFVVFSFPVFR